MNNAQEDEDFSQSVAWDTSTSTSTSSPSHHQQSHQPPDSSSPYSAYTATPTPTQPTGQPTNSHRVSSASVKDGKIELEGTSDIRIYLNSIRNHPRVVEGFKISFFFETHWLKISLLASYPPLPEKHRMEYVVGDRFSHEFIERRRIDLERFLQRLARHPSLSRTGLFQNFLESTEWNVYKHKHTSQSTSSLSSSGSEDHHSSSSGGLLDNLSDTLLNAFSKLKKPDERFTSIRSHLDSFEEGLSSIERLGTRSKSRLSDLSGDYEDLAVSIQGLGYLESGITEPLMRFERALVDFSNYTKTQSSANSSEFLEHLHGLLSYSKEFKGVLKLRDQKQLDFEELSSYLSNVVSERDRLSGGYGYGLGLTSYFKERFEGLKGGESDMSKAARLLRLDGKIKELQEAVLASQNTLTLFNDSVLKEHETFREIKRWEMKGLLKGYAEGQIEFQKKVLDSWNKTIPHIKRIHVEP